MASVSPADPRLPLPIPASHSPYSAREAEPGSPSKTSLLTTSESEIMLTYDRDYDDDAGNPCWRVARFGRDCKCFVSASHSVKCCHCNISFGIKRAERRHVPQYATTPCI